MLTPLPAADEPLPLKEGCWVMCGEGTSVTVARVKDCYRDGGKVFADLSIYANDGTRLGRTSPAMGGPKSFEPACNMDGWVRIERPAFPLEMEWAPVPGDPNRRSPSYAASIKVLPFGEFVRPIQKRRPAPRPLSLTPKSDYNPALEASAKRMAAQEMRDLARNSPGAADALRARAQVLEDEADRIAPRSLA